MAKEKNKGSFFRSFKAELKKVIWPTPKQLITGTIAVITIVLIIAAIVFVLDLAFDFLNTAGLNRIKERVTNTENSVPYLDDYGTDIIIEPSEIPEETDYEEVQNEDVNGYETYENYDSY